MRRTTFGVAGLALMLALGRPSASVVASDHEPPRTFVIVGQKSQRGSLGTYCWVTRSFPGFSVACADGIYSWPKAKRVKPAARAAVFLEKLAPPEELSLYSWRKVNSYDYPKGPGKEVAFRLLPAVRAGQPGWAAQFTLPRRPGHYYVSVFGRWTDEEGSFFGQDASWTFHLRLV